MQMFCVCFQLVDISFQRFNGFLKLAFPAADSIDKAYLFFFFDLIKFFTQPFHGMQSCFAVIDHFDSIQRLTFFDERNDLSEQTGLMLCN